MGDIRRTPLTTAYLGSEQTIPSGTRHLEVWGVDADPATAHAAIWLRISDQQADDVEILIAAGSTYDRDLTPGDTWTYNCKSVAGTPHAQIVLD